MKKTFFTLLILFIFLPCVYAYSDYLIASGKNIGIELKSTNVIVVGSYDIGNYNVFNETNLRIGDKITKINNSEITSVTTMQNVLNEIDEDYVEVTYIRNNKEYTDTINLYKENNEYKTGLYIKDIIRGVAALTYIDVENKTFGALGHEILEKTTKSKFESNSGTIFSSTVTNVTKSTIGNPGEKYAQSNPDIVYGTVKENTTSGIFGSYTGTIPKEKLYKVATPNEVKLGSAKILTVIDGDKVEEFDISIIKINLNSNTKNILFEITDKKLISATGGIIQGMSGSPIIQGDNIVGAVNYVIVDSPTKGYGIFITNMLEEAEK